MKQISLRLDENQYSELKNLSEIYNKDYSQIIRDGIDAMIDKLKNDPWYMVQKMMDSTPVMEKEEEKEILDELNSLTADNMEIVETRSRRI